MSEERDLFVAWSEAVKSVLSSPEGRSLSSALNQGRNTFERQDLIENSSFDDTWIEKIEDAIPDLTLIVNNPRETTKQVPSLVPVELARKTGAESVMYLSTHSQYVKNIDEDGNVVPSKILNLGYEDELHTYENRFVATLIRRLVLFVEKRAEFVQKFSPLHRREVLRFKNDSTVDGAEVHVETFVSVRTEKVDRGGLASNAYVERIREIEKYVLAFYNSPFMKQMKTDRDVRMPILMTNILRKNPAYHHAYELFCFLMAYDSLGVTFSVQEEHEIPSDNYLSSLGALLLVNYLALGAQDRKRSSLSQVSLYSPKVTLSSDDEEFLYGPLYQGPVTFVRVDEAYRKYLDRRNIAVLPRPLSPEDRRYFQDELNLQTAQLQDDKETRQLLSRKKREKEATDRWLEKRIEIQKKEDEEYTRKKEEEAALEEKKFLDGFRRRLYQEGTSEGTGESLYGLASRDELLLGLFPEEVRPKGEAPHYWNQRRYVSALLYGYVASILSPSRKRSYRYRETLPDFFYGFYATYQADSRPYSDMTPVLPWSYSFSSSKASSRSFLPLPDLFRADKALTIGLRPNDSVLRHSALLFRHLFFFLKKPQRYYVRTKGGFYVAGRKDVTSDRKTAKAFRTYRKALSVALKTDGKVVLG